MRNSFSGSKEIRIAGNKLNAIVDPEGFVDEARRVPLWLNLEDFRAVEKSEATPYALMSLNPLPLDQCEKTLVPDEDPYIILGYDTEYKSSLVSRELFSEGCIKNLVLSYQFYAITSNGLGWSGIHLPPNGERVGITEFLQFALASGARTHGLRNLPKTIYLVGHFIRADMPAFDDFQSLIPYLEGVRGTFVTTGKPIPLVLKTLDGASVHIKVHVRDTYNLCPSGMKRLKDVGDVLGINKVELGTTPAEIKQRIENMDVVRRDEWPLFRRYAITDAEICAKYLVSLKNLYYEEVGESKFPLTLTGIGVELLRLNWKRSGRNALNAIGKEQVSVKYFDRSKKRYVASNKIVSVEKYHRHEAFFVETYHGGRNEEYYFGPSPVDVWHDFDLAGAYPTAMAAIRQPVWTDMRPAVDLQEFKPWTLGYAQVKFVFPDSVRYPTLPVRTDVGIVFPRTGISYCAAPEVALALSLGAKLTLLDSVIIPVLDNSFLFEEFIRSCVERRLAESKLNPGGLKELFWKEISNSTYGKLAQGLRDRRIYQLSTGDSKRLEPSSITNAAYASYITSFVRATLGVMMNSIPDDKVVFSCTTDGFLTNATRDEIESAVKSSAYYKMYQGLRGLLAGNETVLELKHVTKQLLGWRTRGQATLIPGDKNPTQPKVKIYVLAKAGLQADPSLGTVDLQNNDIVSTFLTRKSDSTIRFTGMASLRDMIEDENDFTSFEFDRRLNMEFDWKRKPDAINVSSKFQHLAFTTVPWDCVEQFTRIRDYWEVYNKSKLHCLKSKADFEGWAQFLLSQTTDNGRSSHYKRKSNGDLQALRKILCSAYHQNALGVEASQTMTQKAFAALLEQCGVPCSKANVENGKKQSFMLNSCIAADDVMDAISKLLEHFPKLAVGDILIDTDDDPESIDITQLKSSTFLDRLE